MSALNYLTGTTGYAAILVGLVLAVLAHFFAPRAWSALAWVVAFGVLGAAFVGQREITAGLRLSHADAARQRAEEARDTLQAVIAWREAQRTLVGSIDTRITKEVSDARLETERRLHGIAAGTVRVRYVVAQCPRPDLPATADPGRVGDAAGVELSAAAGQDVLVLRQALIEDRAKIEYLQGYVRALQTPAPAP